MGYTVAPFWMVVRPVYVLAVGSRNVPLPENAGPAAAVCETLRSVTAGVPVEVDDRVAVEHRRCERKRQLRVRRGPS